VGEGRGGGEGTGETEKGEGRKEWGKMKRKIERIKMTSKIYFATKMLQ